MENTEIVCIKNTDYEIGFRTVDSWDEYESDFEDKVLIFGKKHYFPRFVKPDKLSTQFQEIHSHCSKFASDVVDNIILDHYDALHLTQGEKEYTLNNLDYTDEDLIKEFIDKIKDSDINCIAVLPIYVLDHSGVRVQTTSFNDRWDSGRLGFIYRLFNESGNKTEALEQLEAQVKEVDEYLQGNIVIIESITETLTVCLINKYTEVFEFDDVSVYSNRNKLEEDIKDQIEAGAYTANKAAFLQDKLVKLKDALRIKELTNKLIDDYTESSLYKPLMEYLDKNLKHIHVKNIIDNL